MNSAGLQRRILPLRDTLLPVVVVAVLIINIVILAVAQRFG